MPPRTGIRHNIEPRADFVTEAGEKRIENGAAPKDRFHFGTPSEPQFVRLSKPADWETPGTDLVLGPERGVQLDDPAVAAAVQHSQRLAHPEHDEQQSAQQAQRQARKVNNRHDSVRNTQEAQKQTQRHSQKQTTKKVEQTEKDSSVRYRPDS